MYACILRNSYIVAFIVFLVTLAVCYLFDFRQSRQIKDGKIVRKLDWRIPLAFTLIFWLIWHFMLFPPAQNTINGGPTAVASDKPKPKPDATVMNMKNWI